MKKIIVSIIFLFSLVGCVETNQDDPYPSGWNEMDLRSRIVYAFNDNKIDIKGVSVEDGVVKIAKDAYVGSGEYIRYSINADVIEMGRLLKTAEEISEVQFFWYADIVDKYGNSNEEVIMFMSFAKDTLDKINFDNVSSDNIPDLADKYQEHRIFTELGL